MSQINHCIRLFYFYSFTEVQNLFFQLMTAFENDSINQAAFNTTLSNLTSPTNAINTTNSTTNSTMNSTTNSIKTTAIMDDFNPTISESSIQVQESEQIEGFPGPGSADLIPFKT